MKNMDNLYDILQIDDKIRDIEIKKAYIKMLRKYPPEKCPEEFKKIREAYEILIDPVLKAEYNAFINHKDNINEYRKKGNNALDKKQYRRAILYYKKILLIEPKLTFAKNKLGLVFFYDKQYEEAIIQFRELIQLNPHNSIFYNNLAYVYKEQRKYDLAEELLLKSYNIDSTNEKTVLVLVDIYIALGDYEKGIKFINRCIEENESDTFKEIMYYLKLIRIYVNINNINMISQILDRVKNIIPDEEKVKEYVVWKLQKILEELLKDNDYELGYNICEKLLQIDSKSEKILNLYNKFNEILKVHDLLKELARDERIIECLKKPI
ncbi:tetratricopeptide repeat protein, partial [Clostridium botulinum C/D]|nr:tetratricopeptide repeat protein [Clostridium botulinum C/D]